MSREGSHGDRSGWLVEGLMSPAAPGEHVFRNTIKRLSSQPDLRWDGRPGSELPYGNSEHKAEVNLWDADLRDTGTNQAPELTR